MGFARATRAFLYLVQATRPEKKTDFVSGTYELEAPQTKQTVAIKIIDMLGEEVLVTKTV
jgi:hypothetical protein